MVQQWNKKFESWSESARKIQSSIQDHSNRLSGDKSYLSSRRTTYRFAYRILTSPFKLWSHSWWFRNGLDISATDATYRNAYEKVANESRMLCIAITRWYDMHWPPVDQHQSDAHPTRWQRKRKTSGSAETRTRVAGFKVQSANRYTTGPHSPAQPYQLRDHIHIHTQFYRNSLMVMK